MDYPIIDGDTHINEPVDLWERRVAAKYRDRAPRVIDTGGRKSWLFDGQHQTTITLLCNAVGESRLNWKVFSNGYESNFRSGGWDPRARLADMDLDMVGSHVLFPTYSLAAPVHLSSDRDVQVACVRAYNDWLSEFASEDPDRLIGIGMLPITGVDDAIAEATRVRDLPGMRGVLLSRWPNGSGHHSRPEDERFWSAVEDLDLPVAIHVGFGSAGEVDAGSGGPDMLAGITLSMLNQERQAVEMIGILGRLILDGILERHPRLRVCLAEVGAGWIPFFLEQTTDNFKRHRFWTGCNLKLLPAEYWRRQCFATFQVDRYAIRNRDLVGVETMMWSSDYPHTGADWPDSLSTISNQMDELPYADRRRMLHDNAARLYGLTSATTARVAAQPALIGANGDVA